MSISEILDPNTINESWKHLNVYSINVATGINLEGNITVSNPNPQISIINSEGNTNRSTLLLKGGPSITELKIQQEENGGAVIQNFNNNSNTQIINTGTGFLNIVPGLKLNSGSLLNTYSDSNLFSPTLTFGGGSTGLTYTSFGNFTRIGNCCFISMGVTVLTVGSSTGQALLGNLPFAPVGGTNLINFNVSWSGLQFGINYTAATAILGSNDIQLLQESSLSALPQVILTNTSFIASTSIKLSGFYFC